MKSYFRAIRDGHYLLALLVGALALVAGTLTWPGLMIQALAVLVVSLRTGTGPGLVAAALVWLGTAGIFFDSARQEPGQLLNLVLLGVVCAISTWLGGTLHVGRQVLRRQAEQQSALAEVGRRALMSDDADVIVRDAVAIAARALGVEFCHYLELQPDGRTLLLRAGVGWEAGLVGTARLDLREGIEPSYLIPTWGPFILETLESEQNAPPPPWLYKHGAQVGFRSTVPCESGAPRGVLGAYARSKTRTFTAQDVHFLEGMAFLVSAVLARQAAARAVEQQLAVQGALLNGHDALREGLVLFEHARATVANSVYLRLVGRDLQELRAVPLEELLPGLEVSETGVTHNYVMLQTRGEPIPVEASSAVFSPIPSSRCLAVLVRDLRPHQALERQLEVARDEAEREAHSLAGILAALPVGVAVADATGRIRSVNAALKRIWGEDMPIPGGLPEYGEFQAWFEGSGEPVLADQFAMSIALLERRPVDRRHLRIASFDGKQRYVASSAAPLFAPDGKFIGAVSVHVDETEEVEAQRELMALKIELEERVRRRTGQLEAANRELQAFSYTVAHDLRAPLRAIHGFTDAILKDFADGLAEPAMAYLQRVLAAARRMDGIIQDLLRLSEVSRSPLNRVRTDLSGMAREVLDELAAAEPDRKVDLVVQPGLEVEADPDLVRILLDNLLGNAWKFTRDRTPGRIEVSRDAQAIDVVVIQDNGVGFDPVHSERIFLPFERLVHSSLFDGSGIGLSIVRRIVDRHGGWIRAKGVPEQGASFRFSLSAGARPDDEGGREGGPDAGGAPGGRS